MGSKTPKKAALSASVPYAKPGPVGGRLIRQVIGTLKAAGLELPLSSDKDSHILIAVSAGSDSVALATLVSRYGRKLGERTSLRLLHVNHGWRGAESDADELFVRDLAKKLGVKIDVVRLKNGKGKAGESWEAAARRERKRVYKQKAERYKAVVLTAHQADDLAETMLWRILTGAAETHGGGIHVRHGVEVRPFLRVRKDALREFLLEENQPWREDATNHQGRFLRAKMRQSLMPIIESLFPKAIEHLVELGFRAFQGERRAFVAEPQRTANSPVSGQVLNASDEGLDDTPWDMLFGVAGIKPRRVHWQWLKNKPKPGSEIHLAAGWRLIRETRKESARRGAANPSERWRLERS